MTLLYLIPKIKRKQEMINKSNKQENKKNEEIKQANKTKSSKNRETLI